MYYDRTLSDGFSKLIEHNGSLRWLFDFVKKRDDLDFLIGKNNIDKNKSQEWISIYRGLTRILRIRPTKNPLIIKIDAAPKYKNMVRNLYGAKTVNYNFQNDMTILIKQIENSSQFDRYFNNKKEGYYQNELSRKYGICGNANTDFVIIDKEAVIGYLNEAEKSTIFRSIQSKYKHIQKDISTKDPRRYGNDLDKKAIGNELDFLALDKEGNILLIEYKHGSNTSGIYLSPLQIGLYYDIFKSLPRGALDKSIYKMLAQKQKIGLINPGWKTPQKLNNIIPALIISEYNYNSTAKSKFDEILQIARPLYEKAFLSNLRTYNFTLENGLSNW